MTTKPTSVLVTFSWLEHRDGDSEGTWVAQKVHRKVRVRKTLLGQGREVERRFLAILTKRCNKLGEGFYCDAPYASYSTWVSGKASKDSYKIEVKP